MLSTKKTVWVLAPFALALILLAICTTASVGQAPLSPPEKVAEGNPIEPDLLRALLEAEAEPDSYLRVMIYLHDQADLDAAADGAPSADEARTRVVSALQDTATRSQAQIVSYLDEARTSGDVEQYTQFWIVNAIAVQAQPVAVRELAIRPEVASIRLDHYRQWITEETPNLKSQIADPRQEVPRSAIQSPQSVEWGIAKIRADEVWTSLHISGTGVVVAGMDTGVDWLHPALQANYRGYNPHGPANHTYNWHDTTDLGAIYPVDDHGHGTHTMGTIAGQGGIGVAPGAQWIAAKVLNNAGYGYDSWIHAGFQWLLAPGGDSSMAPDVVNCSWGNDNGYLTTFQTDLQAMRAAGIFVAFANGNNGPGADTVGSPASLPEAFAVGATDEYDLVAYFSSRGPSPWGEIRPHVVAPGVNVRSSTPGGGYSLAQGTSMATPHVTGVAALLRSVSPTLSITRTASIINSTAVPLGSPIPNNDTGWGRVDAFAAVASLAHPGFITGTVTQAGSGTPIVGAMVSAAPHSGGGTATTDNDGHYKLTLAPSIYDLTVSAFGYESATVWGTVVTSDTTTVADVALSPFPTGDLQGHITDADTSQPVTATVTVLDTPREAITHTYTFALPEGTYTIRARSLGYRVVTATVHVTAGLVTSADMALPPAPSILLIDSGAWYYDSQAAYFRQALDDLAYAYDERPIRQLPEDVPEASDLEPYDIVVWTAPQDAPGHIGAQDAIIGYLEAGGRLFLSGQDVGFLDGSGLFFFAAYYRDYLKAQFVQDSAGSWTLAGAPEELFASLTITITGAGGADNQTHPDEIAIADPDAAAPVFFYKGSGCGGLRADTCLGYRVVYLSFGFEAINDRQDRREIMGRTLEWLIADPLMVGLELKPDAQVHVSPPGAIVTHTLRVRHLGQTGSVDTFTLTLSGASWASELSAPSLTLSPCTSATIVATVTIPTFAAWDARDVVTVTARSTLSPTLSRTAIITTKAPAPVLLVDDDLFYEQREKYETALNKSGIPHDFWQTCPATGWCIENTPPPETLHWYPIVIWWTGYDWYQPVRADQIPTLQAYLDGGGRLFLSSQDYLYYNYREPFSQDYLGVLSYTESTLPIVAQGMPENLVGSGLGPWELDYPFENLADGVEPMPGTAVSFRDEAWHGIGLARRNEDYATTFFAFPFEALPEEVRSVAMQQAVGWLSWLGSSTFQTSPPMEGIEGGQTITYTAALRNDGPETITASFSNTLPVSLTLVPGSLTSPSTALGTSPAAYSAPTHLVSWEGKIAPGETATITYQAAVTTGLPALTPIANTALLGLEDQRIRFNRTATVRMNAPDLSPSTLRCAPSPAEFGRTVTCTLAIANGGPGDAPTAVVTNVLPSGATFITTSLTLQGGGTITGVLTNTLRWTGPLTAGDRVTVTYQLALPTTFTLLPVYDVALLEDGTGEIWERATWVLLGPRRYYFPLMVKNDL